MKLSVFDDCIILPLSRLSILRPLAPRGSSSAKKSPPKVLARDASPAS
jgi:hypothetical protein